ncbi:MAG: SurA N-terminal domain-containing protein [Verrucomicrobiota bacterium]
MPMMISKFHRLIQSRLLWASFLVIIVFSFVIWGMQMPGQSKRDAEANAAGKLGGKFVSQEEFRSAYVETYMSAVLSVGRPFEIRGELDQEIRDAAWRRLAALREAKRLGLTGSDEEVTATLQAYPGFQVEGRFSPAHYNGFVQNTLAGMGFTEMQFEEHVREEIALQKLRNMVQQAVLISPYEVGRTFRSLSDSFDVEYVVLKPEDFQKDVKVTRDDAHAFFLSDPAKFKIPERVKVQYVEIPVSNYLANVKVTEDDALGYYDEHIDDFTITNEAAAVTNKAAAPETNLLAAATHDEVEAVSNRVTTLNFDQVKTNIMQIMVRGKARDHAADVATDFVVTLAPDREGNAPKFEEAAAKVGLTVKEAGPFTRTDPVEGIDAGPKFNEAAFVLNKTPDEYFSDAVVGSNHVYVVALQEKMPERVPEFDEVADKVMAAAQEHAMSETLTRKAQEIREAVVKAVEKKQSFAKAVEAYRLKPLKTGTFTVSAGLETNEYSDVLIRGAIGQNEGEVTDLLSAEDAVLIAYVEKRTPGDAARLESLMPQIKETVRRQRGRILFEEWEDYLLRDAGFEDRFKQAAEEAQAEEEAETNVVEDTDEQPLPEEPK